MSEVEKRRGFWDNFFTGMGQAIWLLYPPLIFGFWWFGLHALARLVAALWCYSTMLLVLRWRKARRNTG